MLEEWKNSNKLINFTVWTKYLLRRLTAIYCSKTTYCF